MTKREQVRQKITAAAGALKDAVDELVKLDEADERGPRQPTTSGRCYPPPAPVPTGLFDTEGDFISARAAAIRDGISCSYANNSIDPVTGGYVFSLCDVVSELANAVAILQRKSQ